MEIGRRWMLIDGEWVEATTGQYLPVENPARKGTVVGEIPRGGPADVERAVRSAARAFEEWKRVPPRERGKVMTRIGEAIEARAEEIARITALETGNAIRTQSRPEALLTADIFRYFGGVASEIKGEVVPLGENLLSYSRREPIGVVGGIVPWNSPVGLAALKIAMSITAGNTLVLKPSSEAPLAVLKLSEICAGFLPKGVLNVVTGTGSECGIPLARHPLVRKLTFTGSHEIGRTIMEAAAERIVPITLELGGKSPQIVFPDADEPQTVEGVFLAMRFTRQGQSCTAGSRLFLHESIYDSFLEKLIKKLKNLKIGDPLDEATDVGALINRIQFEKVCAYVEDGLRQKGARLLTGGLPPKEGPLSLGYFMEPTVIGNVQNEWRIAREEIFGPVVTISPYETFEEAIALVNDSRFGLQAGVFTSDLNRAFQA
ncbi:MAG: aldehyde dehydrogenase family protein, partial [Desulfobacterota bacterium]|nr:aldehyde dehydrogenase family protein [Thermodesulfobacteriota bacterium]